MENLFFDDQFNIKISADVNWHSISKSMNLGLSNISKNARHKGQVAPEISNDADEGKSNEFKYDVYPLGILLHVMCEGGMPYVQGEYGAPMDFIDTLKGKNPKFLEILKFMLATEPEKRWDIAQIKASAWFNADYASK